MYVTNTIISFKGKYFIVSVVKINVTCLGSLVN